MGQPQPSVKSFQEWGCLLFPHSLVCSDLQPSTVSCFVLWKLLPSLVCVEPPHLLTSQVSQWRIPLLAELHSVIPPPPPVLHSIHKGLNDDTWPMNMFVSWMTVRRGNWIAGHFFKKSSLCFGHQMVVFQNRCGKGQTRGAWRSMRHSFCGPTLCWQYLSPDPATVDVKISFCGNDRVRQLGWRGWRPCNGYVWGWGVGAGKP